MVSKWTSFRRSWERKGCVSTEDRGSWSCSRSGGSQTTRGLLPGSHRWNSPSLQHTLPELLLTGLEWRNKPLCFLPSPSFSFTGGSGITWKHRTAVTYDGDKCWKEQDTLRANNWGSQRSEVGLQEWLSGGRERQLRAFSPHLEEDLLLASAVNDRGYIVARICF